MSKNKKPTTPDPSDAQKEWEEMLARMSPEELKDWSLRQHAAEEVRESFLLGKDEEWEAMIMAMSHEDRAAYFRRQSEVMLANPDLFPEVPLEVLEESKALADKYDEQNELCRVLEQKTKIAIALRDSTAEAMLLESLDDKGH